MRKQKKKSRHSKQTHNRQYKDRLWRMIFNNKEDLLQLYNAINHTDYQNPDDLEVNTLEDVLYLSMKNDVSFLVGGTMNLYEHQSTFNHTCHFAESFISPGYMKGMLQIII